ASRSLWTSIQTGVVLRCLCPWIRVEPASTLASEGVELEFRCPTPSESCRLVLSTQQKFLASPQFLVLRRGEERTLALNTRSSQGAISFNFSSLLSFAMKRKQKRFLQMTLLFMVALIFLPNIGLWSLYKEKHLVKSTEPGEQQVSASGESSQEDW
uniref:Uncharacterized protein n=1 Tax=Ursus americanus TaxID=9643 RepID=A0A452RKY3_URSAM